MSGADRRSATNLRRLRERIERVWGWVALGLLILVVVTFIWAWVNPAIHSIIIESGAINALILALLLDVSYTLVVAKRPHEEAIQVSLDRRPKNRPSLLEEVALPKIRRADLLEYSSRQNKDFIYELGKAGCEMRILLKHPDKEVAYQQSQIRLSIQGLLDQLHDAPKPPEIRCYRARPSLHGVKLYDQVIGVGWYTPNVRNPEHGVRGHSNPLITARLNTEQGQKLERMFDGLFEALWKESEKAEDVLRGHEPSELERMKFDILYALAQLDPEDPQDRNEIDALKRQLELVRLLEESRHQPRNREGGG